MDSTIASRLLLSPLLNFCLLVSKWERDRNLNIRVKYLHILLQWWHCFSQTTVNTHLPNFVSLGKRELHILLMIYIFFQGTFVKPLFFFVIPLVMVRDHPWHSWILPFSWNKIVHSMLYQRSFWRLIVIHKIIWK